MSAQSRCVRSRLVWLAVLSSSIFADQPARNAEVENAALTEFTVDLGKCQDSFIAERHWGKKPLEIERLYVRVPNETAKKYARVRLVASADLPIAADGVAFLPTIDGFAIRDTQYRYEFEPRPGGVRVVKISRTSPDGTWQTGHPCAPKPK